MLLYLEGNVYWKLNSKLDWNFFLQIKEVQSSTSFLILNENIAINNLSLRLQETV